MLRYLNWLVALWQLRGDRRVRTALAVLEGLTWRQRAVFLSTLARDPRLPKRARLAPLLIAAYVALPVDLIPDFIPFFGQLDDALFVTLIVQMAKRTIPHGLVEEHARKAAETDRPSLVA